jgi:hypothetical protein
MDNETTRIQHIKHVGEYQKNGETNYTFDCILENGMVGQVTAKTMNRWAQGEEVVVRSHMNTKYGPRLSLDKANASTGYANKGTQVSQGTDARQESIVKQWAIREAQVFWFGQTSRPDMADLGVIFQIANQFKAMHDHWDEWYGGYKEREKELKERHSPENLPFREPIPKRGGYPEWPDDGTN